MMTPEVEAYLQLVQSYYDKLLNLHILGQDWQQDVNDFQITLQSALIKLSSESQHLVLALYGALPPRDRLDQLIA